MNNKFTILEVNNSQAYFNIYGYCIHTTSIPYDNDSELILMFKGGINAKKGENSWYIDKHYINKEGTHFKGIGETNIVDPSVSLTERS